MTEYGRIHTDGSRSGGQPVLKPCPFCGSAFKMGQEPHDNFPVSGMYYIYHDYGPLGSAARECPVDVMGHFNSADEAIAAWNTRQPTQGYGVVTAANYTSPIGGAGTGLQAVVIRKGMAACTHRIGGACVVPHGVVGVATQSDALREENERLREHLISALDTLKDAEVCDDNCGPCNEARAALEQSK